MERAEQLEEWYRQYRRLLFSIAYQLLGTVSDAEDAVQDTFMRARRLNAGDISDIKSYLCKMVTNRSMDMLKSAKRQRETYFGTWLPEPMLEPPGGAPESDSCGDLLPLAVLRLMEALNPLERAVFVLREVLSFDYAAIAGLVDRTETHCRKLYSNAGKKLRAGKEELAVKRWRPEDETLLNLILRTLETGNMERLTSFLSREAALFSDGGGKVKAAVHPIVGAKNVLLFLEGLRRKTIASGQPFRFAPIRANGNPGLIYRTGEDAGIISFEQDAGLLREIHILRNPDKIERYLALLPD